MDYYKISKDYWNVVKKFSSLQDAQIFADSLGEGYTAEFYAPYIPPTIEEKTHMNMTFGSELVTLFINDNAAMNPTQEQSDALMSKFQTILSFAQVGGITSINAHLPSIPTDEIFTQERKDKYLQMIADYLSQFE